jgi:hypothetical protein
MGASYPKGGLFCAPAWQLSWVKVYEVSYLLTCSGSSSYVREDGTMTAKGGKEVVLDIVLYLDGSEISTLIQIITLAIKHR